MPSPVVSQIILTSALMSATLLILAAFSFSLYLNRMESMNLALAEVAESAARELVELVSVHTLGGGGASYMVMTLPSTLAGQPYELELGEEGENVIRVVARLQIYSQVRVVVTPNFGREPVHVVGSPSCPQPPSLPGLLTPPSSRILIPLPRGRPALVAFRQGGAVCVGFAALEARPP